MNPITGKLDLVQTSNSPTGDVAFLQGNAGPAVNPDASGVISILGDGTKIIFTGNNTAHSQTLTLPGFLQLSGGTMTGTLVLNGNPSAANDAANKAYVDSIASGIKVSTACTAASTVSLTVTYANGAAGIGATLTNADTQAAFSIDGISPALNSRILIKNQSSAFQDGVYTLTTVGSGATNWVLTRATDYDTAAEINSTLVAVLSGTANANTSWLQTATIVTVGTDPLVYSEFTANPATFLQVANNLSDVASVSTSRTSLGLGTGNSPTFTGLNLSGLTVSSLVATDGSKNLTSTVSGLSPTFTGLTLSGLTASRLMASDGSKNLSSVADLTSWVIGTSNRITSTSNGSGATTIDISGSYVGQLSITTLGTIGTGVWQGTLIGPTYGGTGVNNGANTITVAGNVNLAGALTTAGAFSSTFTMTGATSVTFPTSGTLLSSSGASGNYVSSITGTTSQVIASAATGAVTLSLPQSIATTSTPQFGALGIGTASISNVGLYLFGTITDATGPISHITASGSLAPTGGNTVSLASPIVVAGSYNTNAGTITLASGVYIDSGNTAGTITAGYGLYAKAPSYGTTKAAVYSDNLSVGYTAVTPPSSGAVISGNVSIGASSAASQFNVGSTNQFQINNSGIVTAGTWRSSTTLEVAYGGTGQTTYTNGQLLIGNTTGNTLTKATLTGTANQVVVTNGTGSITLSTPQDIATSSTVQFAKLGLGVAASNNQLSINGKASIGFSDTAAPTNGLIVSGSVAINTSTPLTTFTILGANTGGTQGTATLVLAENNVRLWYMGAGFNTSGDLNFVNGSGTGTPLTLSGINNIGFNGTSFGSGTGVVFIANASVNPSTNPTGGGILYCDSGALKFRGSSGTVTPIAPA